MEVHEEYRQKMEEQLKDWSAQINMVEANMRAKCAEELREVRIKQRAAFQKMRELGESRGEAWEQAKEAADKIWEDLKSGIANARSKLN